MTALRMLMSIALALVLLETATGEAADRPSVSVRPADARSIERGRYLVKIAGCNDCHTPGYAVAGGSVPEARWLTGDRLGWRGPWARRIRATCAAT